MILPYPVDVFEFNTLDLQAKRPVIRVGTPHSPASAKEIADVARTIKKAVKNAATGSDSYVVTHHAVDIMFINDSPQHVDSCKRPKMVEVLGFNANEVADWVRKKYKK